MNIIETVKQVISEFPRITELAAVVNTDFTEDTPDNFGIYPIGDQPIKKYITGAQDRQHNFIFYAVFGGLNDYERIANSDFLLSLAYYLEEAANDQVIEATINERTWIGKLTKLSSSNGMLYGYQAGVLTGPVTYQLQVQAQYKLESEVI
jgi:hypothetical protein